MANDYSNEANREEPEESETGEINQEIIPAEPTAQEVESVEAGPVVNNQSFTNPYLRPVGAVEEPARDQYGASRGQPAYVEEIRQTYNPYTNPAPGYSYPAQPPKIKLKKVLTGSGLAMFLMLVAMLSFVYVSTAGNTSSGIATVAASKTNGTVLYSATTNGSTGTGASATTGNETSAVNTGGTLTVQQIVQKVTPAVVQITSQQVVTTRTNSRTGATGSGNGSTGSGTTQATGVGTGIIYDASGLILTNNHVVAGADSLLVTLTDGRSFQGTVVGTDPQTDLAVVKINASNLTVATLGDSSALQVGDGLVAIGNALALPGGPTVTTGVVSALNRSVAEPADTSTTANPFAQTQAATSGVQLYGLIQTDAAINPGNSGGPLINMNGEVVGINTLGAGEAEPGVQAEGIGFAISINQAKAIAQQLVETGSVSHAYLGVGTEPLTAAIANQLGVNFTTGTIIEQVQSGSAAATAGLKAGDIVTAVDGTKLTGESDLGEIINSHQPGDKVTLTVVSPASQGGSGTERSVEVTLGSQAANN